MLSFTFINLFLLIVIASSDALNRRRDLTLPDQLSQSDIDEIVAAHNDIRSNVAKGDQEGYQDGGATYKFPKASDMKRIEWDAALAKIATDYAATCPSGHSSSTSRQNDFKAAINCRSNINPDDVGTGTNGVGENMARNTIDPTIANIKTLLQNLLDDEAENYKYGTIFGDPFNYPTTNYPNANDYCHDGTQCGHFTAGIWANTRYVGCGFAQCDYPGFTTGTRLVCNYYPAGNYGNSLIYTDGGSNSCTSTSCPSGSTCDSTTKLCNYPTPSPATCSPTLSPTQPTSAPSTKSPTAPTTPPAHANCMELSNHDNSGGFWNGEWTRTTDYNNKPAYTRTNFGYTAYLEYDSTSNRYEMHPPPQADTSGSYYGYCTEDDVNDCTAGTWYSGNTADADATFTDSCASPAQNNDENKHAISLRSEDISGDDNDIDTMVFNNMTEMHVILCLLVVVLIILCGMMIGFCFYIRRKNKNGDKNVDEAKMQMVYFEGKDIDNNTIQRATPSRGTPVGDDINANTMNKPTLSISINDKKLMKKVQQTTPVTPLIEDEQYGGM